MGRERKRASSGPSSKRSPQKVSQQLTAARTPPAGRNTRNNPTFHSDNSWLSWRRLCPLLTILVIIFAVSWHHLSKIDRKSSQSQIGPVNGNVELNQNIILPAHQNVSYFKEYSVDIKALMREREEKMKLYDYKYDRHGVDRRSGLSLQEFRDVYDGKWPVILTDVVPGWNAFNWSRDFFYNNYKDERVTMKAVDNSLEEAVSLALPLELFYKNTHKAYPNRWTYIEDELFIATHPQLRQDIGPCEHLEEDLYTLFPEEVRPWNAMLLWGTQFSRSSLHIDPYNWTGTNAVLSGRKRWKLFPPGQDDLLYVKQGRKSGFPLNCYKYNSVIDTYDVDPLRYPAYVRSNALEMEQVAGELLIIPTGWFHQAYNMEETIAISSQVMNRNNVRVVLEEVIKAGNVRRHQLPPNMDQLSPVDQVKTVMSLIPQHILDRGRQVTEDALYQIQHGYQDKRYQLPLDD